MNDAPRSYLTPADRDAEMIEASRLRAMSLRREAVDVFWNQVAAAARRAAAAVVRGFQRHASVKGPGRFPLSREL